jgi:hypothetical protein
MEMNKPLFIPLKTEFYEQFKNGTKIDELRKYGARWNEKTCMKGRKVIISKGYGKQNRMTGVIADFSKQIGSTFSDAYRDDIKAVYGTDEIDIATIRIKDLVATNTPTKEV